FRLGVRRGKWELALLSFPHAYVRIVAPVRDRGPDAFLLRLECTGYRATAPTAALWDGQRNIALPLEQRPRQANGQVVIAFSPGCGECLYHPIDRQARSHWPNQHADLAWGPDSDIVTFLERVHDLLHDSEYHSSAAPASAARLDGGPLDTASHRAA
ncbi:hypothetical protein, partial [uncultured Phenylobacterium sp.]|uniref:DUF7665 family protein n=1 Tax=uncultured Phenylobacterium sp. TaxID=349273 RepID=UPI0025FE7A4D